MIFFKAYTIYKINMYDLQLASGRLYNNSPISYLSPSQLNCPQFCYNPLLPKTGPHSQYITIMPSLQLTCTQDEQFTMLWLFKFNPTLMSTCTISCVHCYINFFIYIKLDMLIKWCKNVGMLEKSIQGKTYPEENITWIPRVRFLLERTYPGFFFFFSYQYSTDS